jgi:hypothetical protein
MRRTDASNRRKHSLDTCYETLYTPALNTVCVVACFPHDEGDLMNATAVVERRSYAGLFMVTLATLMYEILLTRIFSVTMWYHFAFMAVSVAMFGMTVGAVAVYVRPNYFTHQRAKYHVALSSLLFAIAIVVSFLTHLAIPVLLPELNWSLYLVATYVVISVPFIFSGICVCLALTKFPNHVSKLYAADLSGAALGCIILVGVLNVTDGPTAVITVAFLGCLGAVCFSGTTFKNLMIAALVCAVIFGGFAALNTALTAKQSPLIRLTWFKGARRAGRPIYEKWNAFSYIQIFGDPTTKSVPWGVGISPTYPINERRIGQLLLFIDAGAGTVLTAFDGDLNDIEHLKFDLRNLVHYIRQDARVLVIGTGGGRDILSALAFDQKSVVGVEVNRDVLTAVNDRFGDFTGHLDTNPRVTFVCDEARSYIARSTDRFDIIQASMIDTWAATAAGAYVLTENSLYTVEAWTTFLRHLTPDGILTFSRWYFEDLPGEIYRLISLARTSLAHLDVESPRSHIAVLRFKDPRSTQPDQSLGTILVSRAPLSGDDLDTVEAVAQAMQFEIVLSPRVALDPTCAILASGKDIDAFAQTFPINITAPTDDMPFFFHMLRIRDVFGRTPSQGATSFNMRAVSVLGTLLIVVVALTILCIIVPLMLTKRIVSLRRAMPFLMLFSGIGLGFMLIEISQMQRLIIFLGHPTYGLTVVLFSLLVASGIGSYATHTVADTLVKRSALVRLSLLLAVLICFGFATPYAMRALQGATTPVRICAAVAMLFPLGFLMGMPFPLGMKLASATSASLTPWLWGINGAMSVCGSVLAVVISMNWGIATSFRTGILCYAASFVAILWQGRAKAR